MKMVGDIYSKAYRTVIWLGESERDSDIAMDLVADVSSHECRNWDDKDFLEDIRPWTALKALLQRPWWSGILIIQEAFSRDTP